MSYCKQCAKARAVKYQKENPRPRKDWDKSAIICVWCNKSFQPVKPWQKACGKKCGYMFQNGKKPKNLNLGKCARCSKELLGKKSTAIYCSRTCLSMDHNFKHRSQTRVSGVARRNEIFTRDGMSCYICNKTLKLTEMEVDHLVPVSRGGSNQPVNLATSCLRCNRIRGSRIGIRQLEKLFELRPQI